MVKILEDPDKKLALVAGCVLFLLLYVIGVAFGNLQLWEVFLALMIWAFLMRPISKWLKSPHADHVQIVGMIAGILFAFLILPSLRSNTPASTVTTSTDSTPSTPAKTSDEPLCIIGCTTNASQSNSRSCPGKLHTVTLGSAPVTIDLNETCRVVWGVESGKVALLSGAGELLGVVDRTGGATTYPFTKARAVGRVAIFQYELTQ